MIRLALFCILFFVACGKKDLIKTEKEKVGTVSEQKVPAGISKGDNNSKIEGITIMSWNLQWFPGRYPKPTEEQKIKHIAGAKKVLSENPVDVICFQEISNADAMKDLIGDLPDYKMHVISNFEGNLQVGIASSIEPVAGYQEEFHPGEVDPPRGFAFAAYKEGNDYTLVYCVHLKSNWGEDEKNFPKRAESARQLVAHSEKVSKDFKAQGAEKIKIIFSGDFNTDPRSDRFSKEITSEILEKADFKWSWEGSTFEDRVTWVSNGRFPDASFDHFFYRGVEKVNCFFVKDSEDASDHRAIIFKFK